jgi:hypothetical protein
MTEQQQNQKINQAKRELGPEEYRDFIESELEALQKKYKYLLISSSALLVILAIIGIIFYAEFAKLTGVGP